MPISKAATDVMKMLVNDKHKVSTKFIFTLPVGSKGKVALNKEDFLMGYILRKNMVDDYTDFAHIQYCGQIGYTIHFHQPISGIPIEDLREFMRMVDMLENIHKAISLPLEHADDPDQILKG